MDGVAVDGGPAVAPVDFGETDLGDGRAVAAPDGVEGEEGRAEGHAQLAEAPVHGLPVERPLAPGARLHDGLRALAGRGRRRAGRRHLAPGSSVIPASLTLEPLVKLELGAPLAGRVDHHLPAGTSGTGLRKYQRPVHREPLDLQRARAERGHRGAWKSSRTAAPGRRSRPKMRCSASQAGSPSQPPSKMRARLPATARGGRAAGARCGLAWPSRSPPRPPAAPGPAAASSACAARDRTEASPPRGARLQRRPGGHRSRRSTAPRTPGASRRARAGRGAASATTVAVCARRLQALARSRRPAPDGARSRRTRRTPSFDHRAHGAANRTGSRTLRPK